MSDASGSSYEVCPVCHQSYKKSWLPAHVAQVHLAQKRTRSMTSFICRVCSKHLTSRRSYKEHLNTHSNARPFGCEHCDYRANSKMNLRRHVQRKHDMERPYPCPYCDESYATANAYQAHLRREHPDKPGSFRCVSCDLLTQSAPHFQQHLNRHAKGEILDSQLQPVMYANGLSPEDFLCHSSESRQWGRRPSSGTPLTRKNTLGYVHARTSSEEDEETARQFLPTKRPSGKRKQPTRIENTQITTVRRKTPRLVVMQGKTQELKAALAPKVNHADIEDNKRFLQHFLPISKPPTSVQTQVTELPVRHPEADRQLMDVDLD